MTLPHNGEKLDPLVRRWSVYLQNIRSTSVLSSPRKLRVGVCPCYLNCQLDIAQSHTSEGALKLMYFQIRLSCLLTVGQRIMGCVRKLAKVGRWVGE